MKISNEEIPEFWFLTFADSRMQPTLHRIEMQAKGMRAFGSRICIWTEDNLDRNFRVQMKERLVHGTRGFGYWCWKPQIILQLLQKIPEGDVILYVDAGCHLNPNGRKRLFDYYDLAKRHGMVTFQARAFGEEARNDYRFHFLPEYAWTKGDLLRHFGVFDVDVIVKSGQIASGVIVVKKTSETVSFFTRFRDLFKSDFELIDDSSSISANLPGFVENRHDQSVFSIMCKLQHVFTLSSAEYVPIREYMPADSDPHYWPNLWNDIKAYPIWAKRDLGRFTRRVECPDWLKPLLGTRGRKLASRAYDLLCKIVKH